jgi:hypothetical protein
MYIVLDHEPDDGVVYVELPGPADYRTTFSGSALPFPSEAIAFDGSGTRPTLERLPLGTSVLRLSANNIPNWYYRNGIYGPPFAKVVYASQGRVVRTMREIHDVPRTPSRSSTTKVRIMSTSYRAPVVTQEQALMSRAMPGSSCIAPRPS